MTFQLKNKYLVGLASWLNELGSLSGKESRERTRFIKMLTTRINENMKHYGELLEKYVEKGEDGKMKKVMQGPIEMFSIPDDKQEEFNKENEDLANEDLILDVTEANIATFRTVKKIVLETKYTFGPRENDGPEQMQAKIRQANDYFEWAESFEQLSV